MKIIILLTTLVFLNSSFICGEEKKENPDKTLWEKHKELAGARPYTWFSRSTWFSKPWFVEGKSLVYKNGKLVSLHYHMVIGTIYDYKKNREKYMNQIDKKQANLIIEYDLIKEEWKLIVPHRPNFKPKKEKLPDQ